MGIAPLYSRAIQRSSCLPFPWIMEIHLVHIDDPYRTAGYVHEFKIEEDISTAIDEIPAIPALVFVDIIARDIGHVDLISHDSKELEGQDISIVIQLQDTAPTVNLEEGDPAVMELEIP